MPSRVALERFAGFDLGALYLAMDAQRQQRGLTWQQAMREFSPRSGRRLDRPLPLSTVSSLRTKKIAEGDGVLQMLRWLKRTPESFVPGCEASDLHGLPDVPAGKVLRFDTRKLHAALEAQRKVHGLTWQGVANEIGGMSATSLTHLKKGGRTGFPFVMRMAKWLGQPAAHFTCIADR